MKSRSDSIADSAPPLPFLPTSTLELPVLESCCCCGENEKELENLRGGVGISSSSSCCCCLSFFSGVDRGVRFGEAFTDHSEEDNEEVVGTGLGWLGKGGGSSGLESHMFSVGVSGGGMGRIEADVCRSGGGFAVLDQEEDGVRLTPTGDTRLSGEAENVCSIPGPTVCIQKRVESLCEGCTKRS